MTLLMKKKHKKKEHYYYISHYQKACRFKKIKNQTIWIRLFKASKCHCCNVCEGKAQRKIVIFSFKPKLKKWKKVINCSFTCFDMGDGKTVGNRPALMKNNTGKIKAIYISILYMGHSPKLCTKSGTSNTKIQNGWYFYPHFTWTVSEQNQRAIKMD